MYFDLIFLFKLYALISWFMENNIMLMNNRSYKSQGYVVELFFYPLKSSASCFPDCGCQVCIREVI